MAVDDRLNLAVAFGRDDGGDAFGLEVGEDGVCLISLVGEYHLWLWTWLRHDRAVSFDIRDFATGQGHRDREAQAIAPEMDLGREATSRAAKTFSLSARFFLAPAACWSRTMVEIDHLQAVLALAAIIEGLQHHVPDTRQCPAPELPINRRPLAKMGIQVAPRRPGAGDPENAVQHQTMVFWPPATTWPRLNHEGREERPPLVRHQTAHQSRSPQRAALNQRSGDLGIHFVNRA